MGHRKRSHDEYAGDNLIGAAETLARVKHESTPPDAANGAPSAASNGVGGGSGEWQVAESHRNKKRKKLPKKDGNNYPAITHSSHARLQSYVKIGDLQNLVLYLLADGTSPQWCSVKHHASVRKVVCLMVPGLEGDMFNGKIALQEDEQGRTEETTTGSVGSGGDVTDTSQSRTEASGNGNANDETRDGSEVARQSNNTEQLPADPTESQPAQPRTRTLHISPDDYYPVKLIHDRTPAPLQPLSDIFDHIWPIKTPGEDKYARMHSPLAAMLTAPIQKTKEEKKAKGPQYPVEGKHWKNRRTPVTEFMASTQELADEGYVLHPAHYGQVPDKTAEERRRAVANQTTEGGWVDTKDIPSLESGEVAEKDIEQGSITRGRKVLAMDCEMCITSPKGVTPQVFSLTRVSVIGWNGDTLLDEFVKPSDPITDYLTPYSGITAQMLEGVTTTLADIQAKLLDILSPHSILIGHSLNSDLNALKMTHPFVIDTALLFPHPRGPPLKSSLKWLAQKYLNREIQKGHGSTGHNSVEDAKACLDLVKQKCEKGKLWGTSEASGESIFKRLSRSHRPKRDKVNMIGDDEPRIGAVVDWGEPSRGFGGAAAVAIGCQNDDEVVAGVLRAIKGDDDNGTVPRGGCDLVWARLRELEAHRGWWNRSKSTDNEELRSATQGDNNALALADVVAGTVKRIAMMYEALPSCTALVVYSGSGDPRELSEMQTLQTRFKEEYRVKKWDELSVRWTDVEEQRLRKACEKARRGVGFVCVK